MKKIYEANNVVVLDGIIESLFEYDHSWNGNNFYKFTLSVRRTSGINDEILVSISDKIIGKIRNYKGKRVRVIGKLNSYGKGNHIKIYVVNALRLELIEKRVRDENKIFLQGKILYDPKVRITKKNRKLTIILVSVKNNYGKINSFPVIVWGEGFDYLKASMYVKIMGRIENRYVVRKDSAGNIIKIFETLEISTSTVDVDYVD